MDFTLPLLNCRDRITKEKRVVMTREQMRMEAANPHSKAWRKWGPYLSERQWGTVREGHSLRGNSWDDFTHDQARSRAYRWGEDGIAGICDDQQLLCFAIALWNGKDPIIKERLFGLTNSEGNHGEDVKEYYFYLESTPTHSYMKALYKYPQAAYPYSNLIETNGKRSRTESEYELLDTGVFDEDRYFDVFVEYAKAAPEDILINIRVENRGPEKASLHLLPTLWYRNTWSWADGGPKPSLKELEHSDYSTVSARHTNGTPSASHYQLYCDRKVPLLFTENETNQQRIFGKPNTSLYTKDAINDFLVNGRKDSVNPDCIGTKCSPHYLVTVEAGSSETIRLRLSALPHAKIKSPFERFDQIFKERRDEADEFYKEIIPSAIQADPDRARIMRQALAGMLWGKQYYYYDVDKWLKEQGTHLNHKSAGPTPRNAHWQHMYNADVISMPDKWEYPWYAAWDLAFHVLALTLVDDDFGKHQLELMLRGDYLHPSGQLPAYEWNFGDVNPPVHAWATIFTYRQEQAHRGHGDIEWLERCFQKLLLNFTWWVNRKDHDGNNVFEGGFLGLDNIGVFDRSSPLPIGGTIEQADGTAWMALFCQNMFEIALALSEERPAYSHICRKFAEHFVWIASSISGGSENSGMWDEEDGFLYDVLRFPDGRSERLKVRSIVGLLPLCAVTVFERQSLASDPEVRNRWIRFLDARPELTGFIHSPMKVGPTGRVMSSVLNEANLRRVLTKMLDENEFLSPYGIRSLSRCHLEHPYVFKADGKEYEVSYIPADSDSGMFGGNSNWRGPIWMPINALLIRALLQYYAYYGDEFKIECPTGSGKLMNLYQVAEDISGRLESIFLRDASGQRPVYGGSQKFQDDPHWRDYILFYEYFHGDNGAGIGASHQTGWTGIMARMMHLFATTSAAQIREHGKSAAVTELEHAPVGRAVSP
jgi:hypothetical protein